MGLAVLLLTAFVGLAQGLASTDTITWGGDNSRTGYQTNHNMDPSVVGSSSFGQLFQTLLPGVYGGAAEQIFSQPLVYTPSGGTKQYVYVATTQNNVYKLDAKTGAILASRNLHIPFLAADLDGCVDINPNIGITATGVIDPDTDTIYYTSKTYANQAVLNTPQGRPAGRYFIHALDANDLSERPNFPVPLEGIIARNSDVRMFNGGIHHQRTALLHTGQFIYAGFASHCVQYNFTGWIIGWDKTSGKLVEYYAMEGKGVPNDIRGAGVWMSGGGIASDDAGSIWYATGNGYASQLSNVPVKGFNPPTSLEEAAVHMTVNSDGSLNLIDFFMPWEKQALDGADRDLGTSPLEILPSEFSCGDIKRIGVVTGKSGKTYWLNMDNLGGYRNGPNNLDAAIQVYQNDNSVYAGAGVYPLEGGYIYINVIQHPSNVFKFSCDAGVPSFTKVAESPETNAYILGVSHGTTTSLNGQPGTGLFWVTDVQGLNLRIYDAIPKNGKLNMINSFNIPGVMKFTRPVFGDGIVYVGTNQGLFYGFGSPVNAPLNCTSPVAFGNVNLKATSDPQSVKCTALIDLTVTGIALDSKKDYSISSLPTTPLQLATGDSFTIQASFSPTTVGLISNDVVVNTTNNVAGYSPNTHARLTGTGQSAGPLLSIAPTTITFQGIVTGQNPDGVTETMILTNLGNGPLTFQSVLYSNISSTGPWQTWNGSGNLTAGKFLVQNIPSSLAAEGSSTIQITFDGSESGTFSGFVMFVSDGGNQTISIAGSSGPAAVALLEFQTPDASGWVPYVNGTPFTFGNVTENNERSLKFRVTNKAPEGGVSLSLTVSKPPFGLAGLIRAVNQVDLAEGTSLAPGESANATLTCTVPKSQWNVDPYNGTAPWTMNTNDPKFGKQFIQFFCQAVSEQAPPLLPNSDQGRYRYIGCFKENNPGRQLSTQLYGNDNNTNAMCISACAEQNFAYCGTQYHTECWAGNTIPILKVDDSNCNYYCGGDINQVCGGNGDGTEAFISLFADSLSTNSTTPPPPTGGPVVNPGVDGYVSIGCYTEATNARALPYELDTDKRTVKECVDACKASHYTYAGVEYGGECWCGDSFGDGSVSAPITDCGMTCNDNSTEYCGGSNRLNVYKLGTTVISTTTSVVSSTATTIPPTNGSTTVIATSTDTSISSTSISSSSPTPTGPSVNPGLDGYSSIGCYTEATDARALANFIDTTNKTVADCIEACKADSYIYAGLEYGGECWCDNSFAKGSVLAPIGDCGMTCNGNSTEFCGGSDRLNVYQLKDIPVTSSAPATTASSTPSLPTTVPPTTVSPTTSSGTTTSIPTPTGPAIKKIVNNYIFQGCWDEPPNDRAIIDQMYANDSMTLESCAAFCKGFTYFGTEYGRECYCGNVLKEGTVKATNQGDCSFPCAGDDTEFCGAGSRLELYKLSPNATATIANLGSGTSIAPKSSGVATTVSEAATSSAPSASPSPTGPVIFHGNKNFTYYGCLAEPSEGKLMDNQVYNNDTTMTPQVCLSRCGQYKYAGVEYGQECWCGNTLNLAGWADSTPGKNVSSSECNVVCPGNATEYCGAGNVLQLYVKKTFVSKRWRK
ncbi:WSC domain-containing protein ARB_07867 [Trichoderma asperellum]|uniref:WSC domain-containing protein ARB_07867 n=1 Tax=Trichoderma asperellum TaxID=101201 RepID=A0A6V8R519_TRIAP|nr:WSC domain-containing protein ARB_07867 [Trichoderma asperellum]